MLARLACLLLLPATALAQTSAVFHEDPSRGATLPPTSAALADEATAISVNPAGLSLLGGAQLIYLHDQSVSRHAAVDGVYLGDTFFELLGAGFSLEWVHGDASLDYRKTAYALSLGPKLISLGASFNIYSSGESADLDGLTSFDLGVTGRPSRHFSFGVTVRNIDDTQRGAVALERQYDLAIGLRPFGERFSLGVDYLISEQAGIGEGRFTYTLLAQLVRGVSLSAGVSHGLHASDELFFQVAATVDTSHLGLTYAAGGAPAGFDHVVQLRLSEAKYPALSIGEGKVALLDLSAALSEDRSFMSTLLGTKREDPFLSLTRTLDEARRDPELRALVVKVDQGELGLGKAEELRLALGSLQKAGKKVIAVVLSASDVEYLAISGADHLYAVPGANLIVDGLAATSTFLGGSMEKFGVHWDVARVGAYKNAPDLFTRKEMSSEQRASVEAYLDTNMAAFEQAVTAGRHLSEEQLRAALDEGLKSPARAREVGLIDEVLTAEELDERLKKLQPGARLEREYPEKKQRDPRWGERRKVAIIPVIGNISGGKNREDPFDLAKIAGAQSILSALERASEDPQVVAIVLRVDSGGGDTLASDLIYRAVLEAKKKKPVVASMGDVAASGGYYVAMGADEVLALPTTITGSIGVFFIKPSLKGLGEKLGANQETIRRGELAGMLNLWNPWTEAEKASAQKWVDAFYDEFITEVGKARKLPKEKVDELARGRVWSGTAAKERSLIDGFGGLLDAVAAARKRAGVSPTEELELDTYSGGGSGLFFSGSSASLLSAPALPPSLAALSRKLSVPLELCMPPRALSLMEFQLEVR